MIQFDISNDLTSVILPSDVLCRIWSMNFHDTVSKDFSKSIINNSPGILLILVNYIKSRIKCVFSPICLP